MKCEIIMLANNDGMRIEVIQTFLSMLTYTHYA